MNHRFLFFGLLLHVFLGSSWLCGSAHLRHDLAPKVPAYQKIVNALGLRSQGLSRREVYDALMRHELLANAPRKTRVVVAGKKYYKRCSGWSKHKHEPVQHE